MRIHLFEIFLYVKFQIIYNLSAKKYRTARSKTYLIDVVAEITKQRKICKNEGSMFRIYFQKNIND